MKRVLVINLGWEQEPLIDRLASLGFQLYGVHYDDNYYRGVRYAQVAKLDIRDLESIVDFAVSVRPDAVLSDQCDYSHFAQAVVAEFLNLPGPTIDQAQVSSNKYLQRQRARQAGLRVPDFELIRCQADLRAFVERAGLPIILKPVDNRGSFGVTRVDTEDEISEAYFTALVNSHSRLVLAEEFIFGEEITIDGYCIGGLSRSLALATKGKIDGKKQISVDIRYPGELPSDVYEYVMRNNETVTRALGYTFGFTHSEYVLDTNGEPYLVESANRGGGVYTSEIIVPAVTGLDLLGEYVADCIGDYGDRGAEVNKCDINLPVKRNKVVLKFFSFAPGIVREMTGIEALESADGVLKSRLMIQPGDKIKAVANDATRHGFVIVADSVDASGKADQAIAKVTIEYRE